MQFINDFSDADFSNIKWSVKEMMHYKTDKRSFMIREFGFEGNIEKSPLNLYHYTSPNAFLSIIKNKSLRFTDARYMNDKSETLYFLKVLVEFVENNFEKYPLFTEAVIELLKGNNLDGIKSLSLNEVKFNEVPKLPYKPSRHFLFCMCGESDSLNMWNYYVNNGFYEGYNIGFNIEKLLNTFHVEEEHTVDAFLVYHGNVLYKEKQQIQEVEKLAKDIEIKYSNYGDKALSYAIIDIRRYIDAQGLFFKSNKFKSENEYRIVICIADERIAHNEKESQKYSGANNKKMYEDFCVKRGLIVPYLNVVVPQESISRITVSPITEFDIAKKSIKEFLAAMDYPSVPIYKSKIPIRF